MARILTRRLIAIGVLVALGVGLSGCVVVPYDHHRYHEHHWHHRGEYDGPR